jgi:hypothetical protein
VLTADIKRTYPQLGTVDVDYAWAGTLGITVHRMPQIGELGPGVWLASGFGGHGLNTTAMAGNIIARAIVDGDQTWRQFTPFELVWAGGILGRTAAQARTWLRRLRDSVEERRAEAREVARRQARRAASEQRQRQFAAAHAMRGPVDESHPLDGGRRSVAAPQATIEPARAKEPISRRKERAKIVRRSGDQPGIDQSGSDQAGVEEPSVDEALERDA